MFWSFFRFPIRSIFINFHFFHCSLPDVLSRRYDYNWSLSKAKQLIVVKEKQLSWRTKQLIVRIDVNHPMDLGGARRSLMSPQCTQRFPRITQVHRMASIKKNDFAFYDDQLSFLYGIVVPNRYERLHLPHTHERCYKRFSTWRGHFKNEINHRGISSTKT